MSGAPDAAPDAPSGAGAAPLPEPRSRLAGAGMVVLAAALWGTMGLFARLAYAQGAEPLETVSARAAIAFAGLALVHAFRPGRLAVPPSSLPFFAAFGAISIAFFYWIYFAALDRLPVGVAAALLYTAPAFAVLLARLALGEALTRRKVAVLAATLAGTALVTGAARLLRGADAGASSLEPAGVLLGLGAGLAYATFTLMGKRATARFDATRTVFWAIGFGALVLGILAPPWRVLLEHPGALWPILALSLLSTLAANLLYVGGLARLEAGVASMLATVEPVVAALLGWVWLGERLGASQVVGIALIAAGAAALMRRPARPGPAGGRRP